LGFDCRVLFSSCLEAGAHISVRLNDPLSFVTVDSVTTAVAAAAFIGLADEVYHRIDNAWQFFKKNP
jgi:hypothetical protein